jgi:hypothetical protein
VDEYQEAFLSLLARCEDVTEKQQIALFTAGLQPPLSIDVELHNCTTLEDAMGLAWAYGHQIVLTNDPSRQAGHFAILGRAPPLRGIQDAALDTSRDGGLVRDARCAHETPSTARMIQSPLA